MAAVPDVWTGAAPKGEVAGAPNVGAGAADDF